MKAITNLGFLLFTMIILVSCHKDEVTPFDEPFVHIMRNEQSSTTINANRRDVVSYYIYFSSKPITEDLEVDYSVEPGDGLVEGRDYELLTTENPLVFPSGIYRRPIQIRWMENDLDPSKDNTLTITLEGNNLGVATGLPGPDNRQSEFIIRKVNN